VAVSVPKDGDQSVSSALSEISVTFDQDMNQGGFSFTGGGDTFPKVTGQPRWKSPRECLLPVQMLPAHDYIVGLNSATHTNFKNAQGEPLAPVRIRFRTSNDAGKASPGNPVDELRQAIEQHYSYLEVHRVDWPAQWLKFGPRLAKTSSPREFAGLAGEMLAATNDVHIWLNVGNEIVPAYRRNITPNANPQLLPKLIQGWKQPHRMVASGIAAPGIAYLAIHSWERKHQPELLAAIQAELDQFIKQPALIIDVRFNSGGDETIAQQVAARFNVEPGVYAKHRNHGSTMITERTLNASSTPYSGKIVVLMGPVNMSSCETFLLMMKRVKGCQLIGAKSYGASGNPQPHPLNNGVTVMLPSWQAFLPDGSPLETIGITPDIEVSAGDSRTQDAVLDRAKEILTP